MGASSRWARRRGKVKCGRVKPVGGVGASGGGGAERVEWNRLMERRLRLVANNTRFLILPGARASAGCRALAPSGDLDVALKVMAYMEEFYESLVK